MTEPIAAAIAELRARAARLNEAADVLEGLDAPAAVRATVKTAKRRGRPPKAEAGPDATAQSSVGKVGDWTPSDDKRMRELRASGMKWSEVANKLGRSEGATIQRDLVLRRAADKAREAA